MDAILRFFLENDFIKSIAAQSGAFLGNILAQILGPLLANLMG